MQLRSLYENCLDITMYVVRGTEVLTYLLTYLLHGAESFLRS
jgi:hypothetical protein